MQDMQILCGFRQWLQWKDFVACFFLQNSQIDESIICYFASKFD